MTATAAKGTETGAPAARARTGRSAGWASRLFGYCRRYPGTTARAALGSCALSLNALTPLLTTTSYARLYADRDDE